MRVLCLFLLLFVFKRENIFVVLRQAVKIGSPRTAATKKTPAAALLLAFR